MKYRPLPSAAEVAELPPQQARFVLAYISEAGRKGGATRAALAAGYGNGSPESARHHARELLRNPRILSALRSELGNRFNAAAVLALETLVELARDSRSDHARLSAAVQILDRSLGPPISRTAVVTAQASLEEVIRQLDAKITTGDATVIDGELAPSATGEAV